MRLWRQSYCSIMNHHVEYIGTQSNFEPFKWTLASSISFIWKYKHNNEWFWLRHHIPETLIVKKEKYNQLTYLCLCQTTYLLTNKTQKTFAKCEIHFYWQQSIGRHSERTNERNFRRCTFQR